MQGTNKILLLPSIYFSFMPEPFTSGQCFLQKYHKEEVAEVKKSGNSVACAIVTLLDVIVRMKHNYVPVVVFYLSLHSIADELLLQI